jgi:hypothetical protein
MIGSSLNPNHPLPTVRLEPSHGGGKTDLRLHKGVSWKICIAVQQLLNFKIVQRPGAQFD